MRVMLDSNVYDELIVDNAVLSKLVSLARSGALLVLGTHIQRDQLARTGHARKRQQLVDCFDSLATVVPTDMFVFDVSRFDQAKLGPTIGTVNEFDTVLRTSGANTKDGQPGHTTDALIIQTARAEGAVLVTNEIATSRMPKSAPKVGVQVMHYGDFATLIKGMI